MKTMYLLSYITLSDLTILIAVISILTGAIVTGYLRTYNLRRYPDMEAYIFYENVQFYKRHAMNFKLTERNRQMYINGDYKPSDARIKAWIFDSLNIIRTTKRDCYLLITFLLVGNIGLFATGHRLLLILTYLFLVCVSYFVLKVERFYIMAIISSTSNYDLEEMNKLLVNSLPEKIKI